jgi:TM2 domain-containing membrane protein YozV
MDCVNHSGIKAAAYCQNCGKGLCADCIAAGVLRQTPGGKILCDACIAARQSFQQPFAAPVSSGPNPSAAAALGLIPGVGAMYNGQFFKGLIHVVIFAVLISVTDHFPIFGLFIAAWILYQSFEAFHTAKALRDGQPLPDPLGLNEVGNWLNLGTRRQYPGQPGAGPYQPYQPYQPDQPGPFQPSSYQPGPYQAPFTPSAAGFVDPIADPIGNSPGNPVVPPAPPPYGHPLFWRRKEPVGAIVLIALGLLFLLDQLDIFNGRLKNFAWPLALIALGVWLIVRRLGDCQGGSQ